MTKIAIVGESCVDEYVYGTCDRVCPEAAALCFRTDEEKTSNRGMAANVLQNMWAIDASLDIQLISNTNTIIKRRFIDKRYNTIVFREDVYDRCDPIALNKYDFSIYDIIVFSDYCKGFIAEKDVVSISDMAKPDCYIFMDTKKKINTYVQSIDYLKINNIEFQNNIANIDQIRKHTNIIVTRGDRGAVLYTCDQIFEYPVTKIEVRDVCGAGDTFLAALVTKFIEKHDIDTSIRYANDCAAKVVSKFGVSTI